MYVIANFWIILFIKILKILNDFLNWNAELILFYLQNGTKYFKWVDEKKPMKTNIVLLKSNGPLLSVMPMSSTESVSKTDEKVMLNASRVTKGDESDDDCKHCGTYQYFMY